MPKLSRCAVLSVAFLLLCPVRAMTAEEAATPVTVLPNGLTVLVRENHAAPVCTVRVYVRTGSMVEGKYLGAGLSHVLEHLVSGGTTQYRTEAQYEKLLEELGGNANAATSLNWTRYFIDTGRENVFTAIDILSEYALGASITPTEFSREMGVINRELERSLDNPERIIHELALQNLFRLHPCRHPVIGYLNVLNSIQRQDVVNYYNEQYVPNNMIVAVVGDFDAEKVKAHIEKAFSKKGPHPVPLSILPEEPEQVAARRVVREKEGIKGTRLRIDFRTVELTHPDLYPLDILSYILSEGESSRLVRELRDKKQVVQSINTWSVTPSYGAGYFTAYAHLDARTLEAATSAIVEELYRLKTELVSEDELSRAKTQKISDHAFSQQTVADQADELAFNYLSTFDPDFGRHYTDRIQKVTREEIREVARRYFKPEKLCVTALLPKGAVPVAAGKGVVVETTPVKVVKFDNGLTLLLKRNTASPIVSIQAFFAGGLRAETRKNNGICSLTATLMRRGTTTRSAETIAKAFDAMGGSLTSSSGNNSFYFRANILRKDLSAAMEVFADVLLNPTFPAHEFRTFKTLRLAYIERSADNPMNEAERFFRQNLYLTSPYGTVSDGTTESVTALQREDLVSFHKRYVHPKNTVLAIFGDIDLDAAEQLARKYFVDFKGQGEFVRPEPATEAPLTESRAAVKVIQKEGAVVYVGYPGLRMTDVEDRATVAVLDTVLSGYGYPSGWLHSELRGRKLVYEVHAYNVPGVEPGFFAAYARCQPEMVRTVAEAILRNVQRMALTGPSEQEVELAKKTIVTSEELRSQTNESQATDAALGELYGLGYAYDAQFLERVKKVTPQDVRKAAGKYLRNYVLAVTAPDEKAAEGLTPKPRIVK